MPIIDGVPDITDRHWRRSYASAFVFLLSFSPSLSLLVHHRWKERKEGWKGGSMTWFTPDLEDDGRAFKIQKDTKKVRTQALHVGVLTLRKACVGRIEKELSLSHTHSFDC